MIEINMTAMSIYMNNSLPLTKPLIEFSNVFIEAIPVNECVSWCHHNIYSQFIYYPVAICLLNFFLLTFNEKIPKSVAYINIAFCIYYLLIILQYL